MSFNILFPKFYTKKELQAAVEDQTLELRLKNSLLHAKVGMLEEQLHLANERIKELVDQRAQHSDKRNLQASSSDKL